MRRSLLRSDRARRRDQPSGLAHLPDCEKGREAEIGHTLDIARRIPTNVLVHERVHALRHLRTFALVRRGVNARRLSSGRSQPCSSVTSTDTGRTHSGRRVTSPLISSRVRCQSAERSSAPHAARGGPISDLLLIVCSARALWSRPRFPGSAIRPWRCRSGERSRRSQPASAVSRPSHARPS
jgi:hypothetical protein